MEMESVKGSKTGPVSEEQGVATASMVMRDGERKAGYG